MEDVVRNILRDVQKRGDAAVNSYSLKFDGQKAKRVSAADIRDAYANVDATTVRALRAAAVNIARFAKMQKSQLQHAKMKMNGVTLGQRIIPLQSVGCYVPGGRYPLPSSALMSVIPAKIAGVARVIVCSPKISPVTIVAADIAGADEIYAVGGVQAIGALAYGTKMMPRVDKIVGPGNAYVTEAKRQVFGPVGIDFIAGPSEVLIFADDSANVTLVAADMLAQAEHDVDASAILVSTSKNLISQVKKEVARQLSELRTKDVAAKAKKEFVFVSSYQKGIEMCNEKAPEHLELMVQDPKAILPYLINYGSLFIGNSTAEVFGDYCSGTNHILPTSGVARYRGGLSVYDFTKVATYQHMTPKAASRMAIIATELARVEGLHAHERAARFRK